MMDAGLAIRPTTAVADTALVRPEPALVRSAVATTLTPSRSVTATNNSTRSTGHDAARNGLQQQKTQQQQQQKLTREIVFDSQTRAVIFRVIDERTGEVDHQVPDAALLRLRAYNRTMANGEPPPEGDGNTDTEA
jgi:uncharacterized FlaG/YvyC family protein